MDSRNRILIVDDEERICEVLKQALKHRFDITTTTSAEEAMSLCERGSYDMVISDINMPGASGIDVLTAIHARWPQILPVLMTGYNINAYLCQAREHGIAHILAKTAPFNFAEMEAELAGLLSGAIFGLPRYLLPDGRVTAHYEVTSSQQARKVRREVARLFKEQFGKVRDVELVVDEMVSNAIYHAPANPDGSRKYEDFSDVELAPNERIVVECGHDSEKYGVSVSDGSGRLTKETVLERIERHVSGKGLADRRGRGIHLSRMLSDRMIVNIKKGERTEVILLNYFTAKYRGFKPLYVNEI